MALVIRYSKAEGVLRSTDDLPGVLVIAAMPPDHPPGLAIDGAIGTPGNELKVRFEADLSGADWVEVEDVVAGLADSESATVLWKSMMSTMSAAVERALAQFGLEEFARYYELTLRMAAALAEAGYVPGESD